MITKVLLIQECGRHKQNAEFREILNLHRAFKSIINFQTIVWGLNFPNFSKNFDELEKWADVILILENYTSNWLPVLSLSNSKKLKIFWSIDSHVILAQHQNLVKELKIDIVLHSVFGHEIFFEKTKNYWFPNAYPNDLIKPFPNVEKIYDVGFCGNINNRTSYLNNISKHFKLKKDIFVIGNDMVKIINQYKIHFNRNISNDINYRTFETLGCGTFLLTNKTPGLEYLFDIGENIITYDEDNYIDIISFYLKNPNLREEITKKGYNHVRLNHTYNNRVETLVEIINKNL